MWTGGTGPSTFNTEGKEKTEGRKRKDGGRHCLTVFLTFYEKNPLLTQTPDEALRNQDKAQDQENHRGGEVRGDLGSLAQPLQRILEAGGGRPEAWSQLRHAAHGPAGSPPPLHNEPG